MTSLTLLILVTLLAPLLDKVAGKYSHSAGSLLAVVATGIVLIHLLPEIVMSLGPAALILFAVGWLLPTMLEKVLHSKEFYIHSGASAVIILGFLLHTIFDGAALTLTSQTSGLAFAILLHRIPASFLIYRFSKEHFNPTVGWFSVGLMAFFSVVGFWAESQTMILHQYSSYFLAFVAGSLLHISWHDYKEPCNHHSGDQKNS